MKILHVITSMSTGGAESLVAQITPMMRRDGFDVEVALFNGRKTHFLQQLIDADVPVHIFSTSESVYHPRHIIRLARLMRRFDIVHTHNTAPQLFAAIGSVLCSVVLCTTEHNTSNRRRGWRWYAAVDRWMYSRYRKVICISKKAEENLRQFIGKSHTDILTINNGVDVKKYADASPSDELEQIAPHSRKIMMVAGFRWEKDQDTLIKALKHLPENFHLFLVGDGVRRNELEKLAQSEEVDGRVHFLGIRTDVPQLLYAADYIVMSSHFEGLSLSSVEGMSCGKPFLASDVDGLREVVKGAGILFPHGDDKTLINELIRLESDPELRTSVAQRCRSRANAYDISTMVSSYEQIYSTLKTNVS